MSESPLQVEGDTVLRVADGVLKRNAGDETVLLDSTSEEFFGLDGVGARLFELLEAPMRLDAAVELLHAEYDVEREVLAQDIQELVIELLTRHLMVVDH